jgi:hypothetical protein
MPKKREKRSVAQAGSASVLGTESHRFESYLSEAKPPRWAMVECRLKVGQLFLVQPRVGSSPTIPEGGGGDKLGEVREETERNGE